MSENVDYGAMGVFRLRNSYSMQPDAHCRIAYVPWNFLNPCEAYLDIFSTIPSKTTSSVKLVGTYTTLGPFLRCSTHNSFPSAVTI
jgi:hypothetical protein